jgi:hypothetical protein
MSACREFPLCAMRLMDLNPEIQMCINVNRCQIGLLLGLFLEKSKDSRVPVKLPTKNEARDQG